MMRSPTTGETGQPGNLQPRWTTTGQGDQWQAGTAEQNPELMFPRSIRVYDQMRRTDGQIRSLLLACTLPIVGANWDLVDRGTDPAVVDLVRAELGIPKPGEELPARHGGVVWLEHVREALLCLPLGFMPFEQVYQVSGGVVHLRKLGPRQPRTVTEIRVARDGGLLGIAQSQPGYDSPNRGGVWGDVVASSRDDVFIPVDRLVMYTVEREGADWAGTSILRTAYKDWLIKDRLQRMLPQIVERNGMGVPVIYHDGDEAKALQLASDFRTGATAGLALPMSWRAELLGGTADISACLAGIEYSDKAMSRSALQMFMNLGHDNGARSLGETFLGIFTAACQTAADLIAATATEHIVRDLVRWNFGEGVPYPRITAGDLRAQNAISPDAVAALIASKALTADPGLEAALRKQYGLPALPAGFVPAHAKPEPAAPPAPVVPDDATGEQLAAYGAQLAARLTHLTTRT